MEFSELTNYVLNIVLTVILPVVTTYIVSLLKSKIRESHAAADATENENLNHIMKEALASVMDAVLYVNQTYTDTLKNKGEFDKTAQKEAFDKAYSAASNMIAVKSKNIICDLYGSFDQWLRLAVESSVNMAKKS